LRREVVAQKGSTPMSLAQILFGFRGTLSRQAYVACLAGVAVVVLTIIALSAASLETLAAITAPRGFNAAFVLNALWTVVGLVAVWSILALMSKRLAQRGRSGWWAAAAVLPLVAIALLNDAIFLVSRSMSLPASLEYAVLGASSLLLLWVLVETIFLPSRGGDDPSDQGRSIPRSPESRIQVSPR